MATTKSKTSKSTNVELREEVDQLKSQIGELLNLLKDKGQNKTNDLKETVSENLQDYQEHAKEHLETAYDIGNENMERIGEKIQKNPLSSMFLAFGVGYVISKMMTKDN